MLLRHQPPYFLHVVLLFFLCIVPYSETIHHGWHLDDFPNILHNTLLHVVDLSPATLSKTFHAYPGESGRLFRPVANLSFAVNWFFNQDRTYGYHLVNLTLHFLTTVLLYLSCLLLLQSPTLKTYKLKRISTIALLAASLWALAPIHTQAVTYIVQRMAQLAAFFSMNAIFFYLLARQATNNTKRFTLFICCFCCAVLALGSKENAILLPFSLLLIEYIFFLPRGAIRLKTLTSKILLLATLLLASTAAYLILSHFSTRYDHRSFTMLERILTEPRILLFYLSQIFYPSISRLSIVHDFPVSTSLFSPWTTLAAISICAGLIVSCFFLIRRHPLLSFAILFFFLNHLIESTVIPLELLFEHRNYLPSLFLFLPVAALIVTTINTITNRDYWKKIILITACTSFLTLSGLATLERNKTWSTNENLWQDALIKAPQNSRTRLNLAQCYLKQDRHPEAIRLCKEAEELTGATKNKIIPVSRHTQGIIAYKEGDFDTAIMFLKEALSLRDDYTDVYYKLISLYVDRARYEAALAITLAGYQKKAEPQLLLIQASLQLRLNNPAEALETYHTARRSFPTSSLITAGQGKAMSMLEHYKRADTMLRLAATNHEPDSVLLLIENHLHGGNNLQATSLLRQLLLSVPLTQLLDDINIPQNNMFQIPFDKHLLQQALLDAVDNLPVNSP